MQTGEGGHLKCIGLHIWSQWGKQGYRSLFQPFLFTLKPPGSSKVDILIIMAVNVHLNNKNTLLF